MDFNIGHGGTFVLFPHDVPEQNQFAPGSLPEQLHTATRTLGALRLYADDVRELIGLIRRDFGQGRVVVTYNERGTEISKYATDFENDLSRLDELRYLKLLIQEPEAYGINRLAVVELNANGSNEVRVQGVQESWVIGKAEALASHLRKYQKTLSTTFRQFGLNINILLVVATLVALPELTVLRRVAFVSMVVLISWAIVQLHSRFIPNVLIHLSDKRPGLIEKVGPQFLSWLIAASAALVAAIWYGLLKGELSAPLPWLSNFFQ